MTSSWGRKWGRADLVKLQRLAGVMPVSSICATLKRSEHSVRAKARLLGLDLSVNPYWFTANEIAHAMGVKHHTVNAWVRRGWLPSKTPGKAFFTIQQIKYFHNTHQHLPSVAKVPWGMVESTLCQRLNRYR